MIISRPIVSSRKRRLYALSSFSAANYYATQPSGGEAGDAAGFGALYLYVPTTLDAAIRVLGAKSDGSAGGWFGQISANANKASVRGTSAWSEPVGPSLLSSDLGRVHAFLMYVDSTSARVYWNTTSRVTELAITGYTPAAVSEQLGKLSSLPATNIHILGRLTFRGNPSLSQLQSLLDEARTFGDLPKSLTVPTATEADVIALGIPYFYEADTYVASAGNLVSLTNKGTGGGVLSVAAGTVAEPAADADYAGQKSLRLTGTQELASSLAPGAFSFGHNGSGRHCFVVLKINTVAPTFQGILSTRASAGFGVGFEMYANLSILSHCVGNGSANLFAPSPTTTAAGTISTSAPCILESSYSEIGAPKGTLSKNGLVLAAGTAGAAPSIADPVSTLRLGALLDGWRLSASIVSMMLFDRLLNPSELAVVQNYVRTKYGVVPTTMTHRQSVRDALAGLSVVDGQTAPASLADTVTGAAADAMTRTGSPTVRVIDTSIDGRRTYGACGFSATNCLTTATPGGVRGSVNGFSFVHHAILWSLSGNEVLFHCANASGTQGWYLVREAATLRWYTSNGVGGIASSPTRTLTSADLGRPLIIHGVRDAAGLLYLYLDGVSVGAATGPVASYALASWATMIGVNQALANPAVTMSWFGSGGGSGATFIFDASDVASHYAASIAAGVIATHAKLEHVWLPNADILAAGGPSAGIPAQVQDRVGTDHLTRVGALVVDGTGLRDFTGQYYQSASAASGFIGSVSGWWAEVLAYFRASNVSNQYFLSSTNAAVAPFGLAVRLEVSANNVIVYSGNGSALTQLTVAIALNQLHHIAIRYNGTLMQLFVDGALVATSAAFVYAPATLPTKLGALVGSLPTASVDTSILYGASAGAVVPSDGEIATAAAAALSTGKVVGVTGKTDKRWSIVDDVIEAGGKVPALIKERVSGVDHMVVVGAPLQVAQRVERIYSWESA